MKNLISHITVVIVLLTTSCKKENDGGKWNIKLDDGLENYNYHGVTYNPIAADALWSANFKSSISHSIDANGILRGFNTRSEFNIQLGNNYGISLGIIFSTNDSLILSGLKTTNTNEIRFNAFKKLIKIGAYTFNINNDAMKPFIFYRDKLGKLWATTDYLQTNNLEIISVTPNTTDNAANAIIAQVNYDVTVIELNTTNRKRIKGVMYSFYNLN